MRLENSWLHIGQEVVKLLEAEKLTDIEIRTEGGSLRAHKIIMAAASPFFKTLFSGDFKEKNEAVIDLSATFASVSSLKEVINYVYGGTVELTEENIGMLLSASTYLAMSRLTEACMSFMFKNLKPSNCLMFWNLADTFDLTKLLSACKTMASSNFKTHLLEDENVLKTPPENMIKFMKSGLANDCTSDQVKSFIDRYVSYNNIGGCQLDSLFEFYHSLKLVSKPLQPDQQSNSLSDVLIWPYTKDDSLYLYHFGTNQWYKTPANYIGKYSHLDVVGLGSEFDQLLIRGGNSGFVSKYDAIASIHDPQGTATPIPDIKDHLIQVINEHEGPETVESDQAALVKYFVLKGVLYSVGSMLHINMSSHVVISKYYDNHWLLVDVFRSNGEQPFNRVNIFCSDTAAYILFVEKNQKRVGRLTHGSTRLEFYELISGDIGKMYSWQQNIFYCECSVYLILDKEILKCQGLNSPWEKVGEEESFADISNGLIVQGATEIGEETNIYTVRGGKDFYRYSINNQEFIQLKSVPIDSAEDQLGQLHSVKLLEIRKICSDFMNLLTPVI